jgi:hypothetical protein
LRCARSRERARGLIESDRDFLVFRHRIVSLETDLGWSAFKAISLKWRRVPSRRRLLLPALQSIASVRSQTFFLLITCPKDRNTLRSAPALCRIGTVPTRLGIDLDLEGVSSCTMRTLFASNHRRPSRSCTVYPLVLTSNDRVRSSQPAHGHRPREIIHLAAMRLATAPRRSGVSSLRVAESWSSRAAGRTASAACSP